MKKRIFLDHAATTPLDPEVINAMVQVMQDFPGNPSSIHAEGRQARNLIEQVRKTVANYLQASVGEIFFTSGGTEANNTAIKGAVQNLGITRIITAASEHHCVLHSVERVQKEQQVEVHYLPLDEKGYPILDELESVLQQSDAKTLVSLMHSNNELGVITDIQKVATLCQQYGALFHSDTVQTIGFYPVSVQETPIHFLSGGAHKFNGPKGVGFLYINSSIQLKPFIDGGAQERNMRAGTENLYGIVGLGKALELAIAQREDRIAAMQAHKMYFAEQLQSTFPDAVIQGDPENGHAKILNVAFPPGVKSSMLLMYLDIEGISVSGGSACSSGTDIGSHVIAALPIDRPDWVSVRFSFSHLTTREELDETIAILRRILL